MTVNNVNALFAYAKGQTDMAGSKANETVSESFGQVMTKYNGGVGNRQTESGSNIAAGQAVMPVNTVKTEVPSSKNDRLEADRTDQDAGGSIAGNTETSARTETNDTAMEEVEKSGEELIQDIADEMDVTREDVEAAMALLGLTAIQLFDPDNLRQLLLTISGSTDEMALLTDESLYGSLQDLLGIVEESLESLQKELGMSEQELNAFMKQLISEQGEAGMTDGETLSGAELEGMKDYTVSVQKDGETVRMKVTVDDASGNRSVQETTTGVPKAEAPTHKMQQDASANNGREGNSAGQPMMQMPEMPEQVNEIPETVNMEYRSMQTEEIMNQIMEYMKINLKAETQTMELQLHPASLGTVNVQIMAKEGGLTAHFTTQNETVRAVIETQLIQLKNQFEEQGIKVDAVEVTVANHAYGQQFSQDNGDAQRDQAKAGKGRRQINLDQIESEEDLDEMEESERIAVEMMQASGSTVDYTA